ncbi:MAG: hypothetical protein LBQ57_05060 [Spirochaetales bacterium]|jgi:hypothetical protein|nr:hypothetical protein [Spirochaetales bacterium]
MKRYSLFALGLMLIALAMVSCASAPEPVESEPTPAPAPAQPDSVAAPPSVPRPDEELKKAEDLKKTIDEYGLSFARPDEYGQANDELAGGKAAIDSDNAGAKALLDSAFTRYQGVFDAAIDAGSKNRLSEIAAAKAQADTMKAARAAADEYNLGENKTEESRRLLDEKQYLEAWTASGEALDAYTRSYETARQKRGNADGEIKKTSAVQQTADSRIDEVSKEIEGGADQ